MNFTLKSFELSSTHELSVACRRTGHTPHPNTTSIFYESTTLVFIRLAVRDNWNPAVSFYSQRL